MSADPVTMVRPSAARERILDTAFTLFYSRGIRGVGVDLIIAESGVAKATFYKHFPSKDDLVVAYLDKVDDVWFGQLRQPPRPPVPTPRASSSACSTRCRTRAAARATAAAPSSTPPQNRSPGPAVHDRTVAHKTAVLAWVRDLAQQAGARDPGSLARSLTLLLDGGLASGSLDADPEAPQVAKASARALVDAART